jgi:hypothetical protein
MQTSPPGASVHPLALASVVLLIGPTNIVPISASDIARTRKRLLKLLFILFLLMLDSCFCPPSFLEAQRECFKTCNSRSRSTVTSSPRFIRRIGLAAECFAFPAHLQMREARPNPPKFPQMSSLFPFCDKSVKFRRRVAVFPAVHALLFENRSALSHSRQPKLPRWARAPG